MKPKRFGVDNGNKDHYFDKDSAPDTNENSKAQDPDSDWENESDESNSFRANELSKSDFNVPNKQMAKLEAKIDQIHTVVLKIQRMYISNFGREIASGQANFDEFPLETVSFLDEFDTKLNEISYRKQAVSAVTVFMKCISFLN